MNGKEVERRFTSSERLEKNIERLKALRSHVNPNPTMEELFFDLTELLLQFIDPERKAERAEKRRAKGEEKAPHDALVLNPGLVAMSQAEVRRRVWERDQGKCTYEKNGKRCASTHKLQFDHVIPKAQGGAYAIENLRLRCQGHNLLYAIEVYGQEKMEAYLRKGG